MNVAIFLDLSDLYHRVNRHHGAKLNFTSVFERLKEHGFVVTAHAYGIQRGHEAENFVTCLQRIGFQTFFKRPEIIKCGDREIKKSNWELAIGLAAISMLDSVDAVIVGSGSNTMAKLAEYVKARGKQFIVFGCGIGRDLQDVASSIIKIEPDMLEEPREEAEEEELVD
jgi:uncharacterized LabA/DUF88 family protein